MGARLLAVVPQNEELGGCSRKRERYENGAGEDRIKVRRQLEYTTNSTGGVVRVGQLAKGNRQRDKGHLMSPSNIDRPYMLI